MQFTGKVGACAGGCRCADHQQGTRTDHCCRKTAWEGEEEFKFHGGLSQDGLFGAIDCSVTLAEFALATSGVETLCSVGCIGGHRDDSNVQENHRPSDH